MSDRSAQDIELLRFTANPVPAIAFSLKFGRWLVTGAGTATPPWRGVARCAIFAWLGCRRTSIILEVSGVPARSLELKAGG